METGLRAAKGLQSVLDNYAAVADVTAMRMAVRRITAAVRSTVPRPMREQVSAKLDGATDQDRVTHQDADEDDDDLGYDPD